MVIKQAKHQANGKQDKLRETRINNQEDRTRSKPWDKEQGSKAWYKSGDKQTCNSKQSQYQKPGTARCRVSGC